MEGIDEYNWFLFIWLIQGISSPFMLTRLDDFVLWV